jgi:hypothetical protein
MHMGTVVAFSKLAELRAKTDRDLVRIVHADLDRALALANVAATRRSVFRAQAEAVHRRAKALLPRVSGLDRTEQAELEWKLKELSMALDLVPGTLDPEREPVCC